jgi:hypothetical protein
MHIQQDTTLHSLFYPETALHVSGDTTTHHQERKQLYLQHLLFVTPLLLPAAIWQVAVHKGVNYIFNCFVHFFVQFAQYLMLAFSTKRYLMIGEFC